ncbi:MAG: CvpA family protein [Dehalococcoidales bacterium]|nr:CvpA family protein [Dehalococcoidales bacterium]
MNWLDIVILVLIVVPTLIGLKIGIIKALFTIAGMIVGVVLAGRFSESLGGVLTFISDPGWARIAAFAIILIAVMVIASVLAAVLKKVVSVVLLGWVNRLGGAVLGFVLGAVFCSALLSMWVNFLGIGDTVSDSALANFLLGSFPFVLALLPAEFDSVRSFFQ